MDNQIVDKIYSNITCGDIINLVSSGKVDIDTSAGFEGLKPYLELKQNQNERQLIESIK